MTPDPFIVCDNLVKVYRVQGVEVLALQGLDLAVARGEMLGIVGASGSGKSTLMNILGGLDRPTTGKVWVDGQSLAELPDRELTRYRKAKVGFVWQQGGRNLLPILSALENVELPMALSGEPEKTARHRALELLEVVGLAERARFRLAQLSGGEQQRVAIAVALANQPELVLADEPTGELDSATALSIYQVFRSLNENFGLTILIVSHDPGIARHTHRVVAIHDGRTASETLRVEVPGAAAVDPAAGRMPGDLFEELVVVDDTGRLRVPKDYLERYQIQGRARLEPTPEGILIRPAPASALDQAARRMADERKLAPKANGLWARLAWLARRRTGQS